MICLDYADEIATITLNRPERMNALGEAMLRDLGAAIAAVSAEPRARVVVITGAGNAFCAGGDIKELAERPLLAPEERAARLMEKQAVAAALYACPKPTVAMIGGAALGAGFSLALACDFRVAARSATFGTAFARIGFSGDLGGSYSLTRLVGPAKARELYLLGDVIGCEEAHRIGLVNCVANDADLLEIGMRLARRLAAGPSVAYACMKDNLIHGEVADLQSTLEREARNQLHAASSHDHHEAVRAFQEKRPPQFRGR
jgi:2-(1,2-epoxy-1,2-dihydrophenyl)acetyl-CoA isomerase